jgi:hypothetical protein
MIDMLMAALVNLVQECADLRAMSNLFRLVKNDHKVFNRFSPTP